ncbi:MAG: hypothetical protein OHK0019_21870 [Saprospiraceae bacterium]
MKDYAPIPPNPASLGKYGDIPVSHYTGVPDISIPIYTFTEGNISLPITLSYHASGIRLEEVASWVGLGWALNAGGVITRSIQHSPDEGGDINQLTGYYKDFGHPLNFNNTVCDTTLLDIFEKCGRKPIFVLSKRHDNQCFPRTYANLAICTIPTAWEP